MRLDLAACRALDFLSLWCFLAFSANSIAILSLRDVSCIVKPASGVEARQGVSDASRRNSVPSSSPTSSEETHPHLTHTHISTSASTFIWKKLISTCCFNETDRSKTARINQVCPRKGSCNLLLFWVLFKFRWNKINHRPPTDSQILWWFLYSVGIIMFVCVCIWKLLWLQFLR